MYTMVSLVRCASMLLASRYHAIVTSMPGLVPSAGVTMDERIRNLMKDREQPHLALEVDDPELAEKAYTALCELRDEGEAMKPQIARCVLSNLERMGEMGMAFVDHVREHHPELPFRSDFGSGGDPWAHLPELPASVRALQA
jgi:polysaccharide pyruvyl transferase WcaK-like protein